MFFSFILSIHKLFLVSFLDDVFVFHLSNVSFILSIHKIAKDYGLRLRSKFLGPILSEGPQFNENHFETKYEVFGYYFIHSMELG